MVFPEGLIFYGNKRVDKIFRHFIVFYDFSVLGVKDAVDFFAFIVIYHGGSIYRSIDILRVNVRGKGDAPERVDHEAEYKCDSKQDKIAEKLEYAEYIRLVGTGYLLFRIEFGVFLIEEFSFEFLSVYVPDFVCYFSGTF